MTKGISINIGLNGVNSQNYNGGRACHGLASSMLTI